MKKFFFLVIGYWLTVNCPFLSAQAVELIDLPTAEVVDANHFNTNFRLYEGGGILTRMSFGIGKRVNIGISFDLTGFIGSDKVLIQRPELQFKYRFYDGKKNIPALALGYDQQGYRYGLNKNTGEEEYIHREKGLYLAATQEMITNTEFHFGLNVHDFPADQFFGFLGASWAPSEDILFLTEIDNIRRFDETRLNLGLRYLNTPNLSIEAAFRNITRSTDNERIIRLNYQGKF